MPRTTVLAVGAHVQVRSSGNSYLKEWMDSEMANDVIFQEDPSTAEVIKRQSTKMLNIK